MDNKESLLRILKRLYTKLFLVSLHKRISHYHPSVTSNHHQEIGETLHDVINEIVKDISRNDSEPVYTNLMITDDDKHLSNLTPNTAVNKTTTASMTLNSLSLYLKKSTALEHDPSMAARLRRCVWDHVHTVHRLARSGEERSARLHVNIATNAMKTLSHYMPKDEYTKFYTLISTNINEIRIIPGHEEKTEKEEAND